MTEVKMRGLDSREPQREVRLSSVSDMWRFSGRVPDADDIRVVNERIPDAWYDFYRLHSPDGWDEWHDSSDSVDGRPTEDEWEDAQAWFYGVVRDIDVYSPDGRDMEPLFARGVVWNSVKDGIPGYRDWESIVEPAYDARLRAARRLAPVVRAVWLREHSVDEFIVDGDDGPVHACADDAVAAHSTGRSAFAGMSLAGRVSGEMLGFERVAFEMVAESGRGHRVADVALEVEEIRESAAVAVARREAAALEKLSRETGVERGLGT